MVIDGKKRERIWTYFEEISSIPHGSGNMGPITQYCKSFAEAHQLECIQDEIGNILIRKPATEGYEDCPGIVLQGHLDMVCVAEAGKEIDFEKEGIAVRTDGIKVWADGTSLGADDGIAVAYALAVLEADDIPHPHLEALFTVDEEVGLLGAAAFDPSTLKGTRLINIDSEEEGFLTVSCAGGARALATLPLESQPAEGKAFKVILEKLLGGHSGMEIHKGRINSIQLLGRILNNLSAMVDFQVSSLAGGVKENAIPSDGQAVILTKEPEKFMDAFMEYHAVLEQELRKLEPKCKIRLEECDMPAMMYTEESTKKAIFCIYHCLSGMQRMSAEFDGLVQTSLNAGILFSDESSVSIRYSIRSSVSTEKEELKNKVADFHKFLGGTIEFMAEYPAWEYKEYSPLRDLAAKAYEELYEEKPEIIAIHAGLECGIFAGKRGDLDCISFGPTLKNVHSPKETADIASVERTWQLLLNILREK